MKIKYILALLLTSVAFLNAQNVGVERPAPTEEKPTLNGLPPLPPTTALDDLNNNEFVDYKKHAENLQHKLDQANTLLANLQNNVNDLNASLATAIKNNGELQTKLSNITEERNSFYTSAQNSNNELASVRESYNSLNELYTSLLNTNTSANNCMFAGWMYSPDLGWVYVSPQTAPYFYSNEHGWIYHEPGSSPIRYYYFDAKEWVVTE
jgi:uncharacterized phage infection (PIP) family protein YhgE